ncbi:MAG: ATP-binding protein, partial [Mariprofundus sp.]
IFFVFLVIILGNGFRFGNSFLLYTQALSLIGLLAMTAYIYTLDLAAIDHTLLFWQLGALLVIPLYVFLIGQQTEKAIKAQAAAEETSYNLPDKGPLPVFTFELSKENRPLIVYANSAIKDLFQRDQTDLTGQCVDKIALTEDSHELIEFCRSSFDQHDNSSQNTAKIIYIRGRDKSGNILKLMCTAICMRWGNNWNGVCFVSDITQRETMQEELEAVHRQGYMSTLVAGIVHDFRNVLTNMIGYAEVLQMSSSSESEKQQLEAIIAAGDRGSELITHLLKLSKNDAAHSLEAFTKGAMITQPLENIIGLARLQLPPHIQLVCQIDEPLHDVAISVIEIEQILLNLINNSMHAISGSGQIQIYISNIAAHRLSKPGHPCMRITVTDNGSGISAEDIDNVFKSFWTSKAGQGGSGLGLTMVQRIIKRHQGCIDVTSIAGQETKFTIHIPAYITDSKDVDITPHSPAPTGQDSNSQQADAAQLHILLVDDVPDILSVHQAMLSRLGHTSVTAETGKDALELFLNKEHYFDMIITDYRMPIMDGLELVESIRQLGSNIPILMVTAYAEDLNLQRVSGYQVSLLNKPVTMEKIKQGIANALDTQRSEQ